MFYFHLDGNCFLKNKTKNYDIEMKTNQLNSSQSNNDTIPCFSNENIISNESKYKCIN